MMYGDNPYLKQQGDNLTQQLTQNFQRNVLPGIGSTAQQVGGFGGSRQGVVEANAMNDLNKQISGGLTDLYSRGYQTDQQYDLGRRNSNLGYDQLDLQRWRDEQANKYKTLDYQGQLQNQQLQQNQAGLAYGQQMQDTPLNYYDKFQKYSTSFGSAGGQTYGGPKERNQFEGVAGALGAASNAIDSYKNRNSWWGGNKGMGD